MMIMFLSYFPCWLRKTVFPAVREQQRKISARIRTAAHLLGGNPAAPALFWLPRASWELSDRSHVTPSGSRVVMDLFRASVCTESSLDQCLITTGRCVASARLGVTSDYSSQAGDAIRHIDDKVCWQCIKQLGLRSCVAYIGILVMSNFDQIRTPYSRIFQSLEGLFKVRSLANLAARLCTLQL